MALAVGSTENDRRWVASEAPLSAGIAAGIATPSYRPTQALSHEALLTSIAASELELSTPFRGEKSSGTDLIRSIECQTSRFEFRNRLETTSECGACAI